MTLVCIWKIMLISLLIHLDLMAVILQNAPNKPIVSKQDVLLVKDIANPKCFTRTRKDFTCFFETADNRTYDLLYTSQSDLSKSKKCEMSIHGTENGTLLHVCPFPAEEVFLYTETYIQVVDRTKNITLYNRTVSVEDYCLLEPPLNVSLQPNDKVGELKVSLDTKYIKRIPNKRYRIIYSSMKLGEQTKEGNEDKFLLSSLVPGEVIEVQASVKSGKPGIWSAWSKPVQAKVPQTADDISLVCYTSDLQHVTCHWDGTKYGSEYKLFHSLRKSSGWTEWSKCNEERNVSDTCSFPVDTFEKIKVKLNSTAAGIKPLFFSEEFLFCQSIKSVPPSQLKGVLIKKKLCLNWEAPLPSLSGDLQYEVNIQIKGGEELSKIVSNTSTCAELTSGCQFSVRVRAKPEGVIYSGFWSDWSDVFSGATTHDTDMLLMWCICVSMLIIAIGFITVFFIYFRKLKQYFWPPVPNLEKVLQGFLMDINQQKWSPPVTEKLSFEVTASSVVEIMSDDTVPGLDKCWKESSDLLSSDGSFSTEEQTNGSSGDEVLRDYVTLNKDLSVFCLNENCYVYEQCNDGEDPETGNKLIKTCLCLKPCSCNNYSNGSYVPMAQCTDGFNYKVPNGKGARNPYSNLPLT
ncbi:PREDICTED: thrombopoietin receptor [Cyprinodon variegatus]|uniref:thrombopoietin receptor n=1 Tax=Cyprinodon variegatus TaxID=28743 RepID=UPI0007425071|nr:PREDICTED: thrombopoietin receptor [Cyprinodon variegatus]